MSNETAKTEWQMAYEAAKAATLSDVSKPLADSKLKQGAVVAGLLGAGALIHSLVS